MTKKIILIIILFILLLHAVTFFIDKSRINNNKKPIFIISTTFLKDGGTTISHGMGYKIIYWHFLTSKKIGDKKIDGYNVGYEIFHITNSKYFKDFRSIERSTDAK